MSTASPSDQPQIWLGSSAGGLHSNWSGSWFDANHEDVMAVLSNIERGSRLKQRADRVRDRWRIQRCARPPNLEEILPLR